MKCIVPGANVRILAKAIHSLAKIGDEMYVRPEDKGIAFETVNMAKSAYANFTFSENYFSYYTFGNLDEDDALKCKIAMRSALAVFKAPSTMDRQVESCQIILEADSSKLVIALKYKNGITKTHYLPILDCQALQAAYSKNISPNQLTAQHKVLLDAMQNFQPNLIEITLEVSRQKVLLRNYVDDNSDISRVTRTQLVLGVGEFDRYIIGVDTSITFCVKELRAVLSFAEAVSSPVSIHFEAAGKPIIFIIKNPSFETNVVLSTLSSDADSQSDASSVRARNQTMYKRPAAGNKRTANRTAKSDCRQEINQNAKVLKTKTVNYSLSSVSKTRQHHNDTNSSRQNSMTIDTNEDCLQAYGGNQLPAEHRQSANFRNSPENKSINSKVSSSSTAEPQGFQPSVKSIFSNIIKNTQPAIEDAVPNSPPRQNTKKAKLIFNKCFQTTFDPRMLPGHDVVLAEDSDESD